MKRSLRIGGLAIFLVAGLLLALPIWRAVLTERSYGPAANCDGCIGWASLGNDAWLAGLGIAMLALASILRRPWLRRIACLLALVLAILMLTDTLLLNLLSMRLHMADVFKFGGETHATWDFVRLAVQGGHWPLLISGLTVIASLILMCFPGQRASRQASGLAVLAVLLVAVGWPMGRKAYGYVNGDSVMNLLQLQRMRGVNTPYSAEFAAHVLASNSPSDLVCEAAQGRHPDVVMVIVESLSAHHSALLGGSNGVPKMDQIARQNTWFTAFHANGFTTDQGLIALLDGRVPVPAVGRYLSLHAFDGYGDPHNSSYGVMRRGGYQTAFFTTGNLGFLDKASWLKAMRVEHYEGSEQAYYEGMPRGGFDAANDAALYGRVLQWMDTERDPKRPMFAALLTVETHPPFLDRASGMLDEAGVFHAADTALADLYQTLQARGFFQHGILLITGDHRSMTAVGADEWERFGDSALARIPLIVAGASGLPHGPIDGAFQQTDVLPSLLQLTGEGQVCREAWQGSFLRRDPKPADFVLHNRGDLRGRIDVYYPDGSGWIDLAGDDSRSGGDHPEVTRAIAERIHRDRIERGEMPQDMAELLLEMSRQRLQSSKVQP